MKKYEEKEVKCLISKPRGLLLARRRQSLRRAGGEQDGNYLMGVLGSGILNMENWKCMTKQGKYIKELMILKPDKKRKKVNRIGKLKNNIDMEVTLMKKWKNWLHEKNR